MKKTSRRRFGKQLTGAFAAVTVASLTGKAVVTETDQRPKATSDQKMFRSHDTPPPLEFDNGSFVVEKETDFNSMMINGSRREYKVTTGKTTLEHIKIVDGSGEMLYRKDEADQCIISIELRDAAGTPTSSTMVNSQTRVINPLTKHFIVDIDNSKTLDKGNQGNNDKPTSKKRDHRFRHSGGPNMSMFEITITEGTKTLYSLSPRSLPANGDDLKIMLWLE